MAEHDNRRDLHTRLVSKCGRFRMILPRPAYIETIPKRGYRLISPVELIADAHLYIVRKRPLLWSAAGLAIFDWPADFLVGRPDARPLRPRR